MVTMVTPAFRSMDQPKRETEKTVKKAATGNFQEMLQDSIDLLMKK